MNILRTYNVIGTQYLEMAAAAFQHVVLKGGAAHEAYHTSGQKKKFATQVASTSNKEKSLDWLTSPWLACRVVFFLCLPIGLCGRCYCYE